MKTFLPISLTLVIALSPVVACNGDSKADPGPVTVTTVREMETTAAERDGCRFTWFIDPKFPPGSDSVVVTAEIDVHHPRDWYSLKPDLTIFSANDEELEVTWKRGDGLTPILWQAEFDSGTRTDLASFPNGTWALQVNPASDEDCLRISEVTMSLRATFTGTISGD